MLIALNQLRRRRRHSLTAMLVAFSMCWLLIAAHSAIAGHHLGDDAALCLALAESAALVLAVTLACCSPSGALPARVAWRRVHAPPRLLSERAPQPRSRAGPQLLQVFRQ